MFEKVGRAIPVAFFRTAADGGSGSDSVAFGMGLSTMQCADDLDTHYSLTSLDLPCKIFSDDGTPRMRPCVPFEISIYERGFVSWRCAFNIGD
jgi:hypothetical protein